MRDVGRGADRFRRGKKKTSLDGFYYRRLLLENKVVECSVSKKLGLRTGDTL